MKYRLNALLLNSIGILLAAAIVAAAGPAWSQEASAGASHEEAQELKAELTGELNNDISPEGSVIPHEEPADTAPAAVEGNLHALVDDDGETPVAAPEDQPEASTAGEHAEENVGFPQLNPKSYASQLFWLLVSFVVLYTLMSKIALPRVTEVLDMRQTQKNGNLDRAAHLQEEAAKVTATYETILATAHDTARKQMTGAEQAAADKINADSAKFAEAARQRIAAVEASIGKAKAEALTSLADISAEVAADMVHKVADIQVNKADAKQAVLAEMKKG
jgi:F-type H+-transporting ATPase subunit b